MEKSNLIITTIFTFFFLMVVNVELVQTGLVAETIRFLYCK